MSSYFKDPDRHTRGVNAIAAVDGVTRRRRQIENLRTQAMNRRDLTMARMARQAFSPRAALGLVDLSPTRQATYLSGGKIVSNPFPKPSGGAGGTYQPPPPPPSTPKPGYVAPGTGTSFVASGLSTNPFGTTSTPPNTVITPPTGTLTGSGGLYPTPPPTSTGYPEAIVDQSMGSGGTSGGGSAGSGAASSGASGGGGVPAVDEIALEELNQPGAMDVAVVGMSRNTKLLLLAGLAVGGFLWYQSSKKKKGG